MADNAQLIAQLGEAINKSTASQAQLEQNTGLFNTAIADGLREINATILEINGLLRGIADKINGLQNQITQLELDAGPNPDEGHAAAIADLTRQLEEAQQAKLAASDVMNSALITLNANATVMDRTMNAQKTADMQAQIKLVHDSLLEMQQNLGNVLQGGPGAPQNPGGPNPQAAIDGGFRRRRRTNKKQRKTKTNKNKKQKGGSGFKSKRRKSTNNSDTGRGRGRGKSKKRRSNR